MTENAKTITFVVVGLVAIVAGLVTQPSSAELDVDAFIGKNLNEQFASAEEAKRLRIVRFNEETATVREFEVAERDGLWTIPSKDGYPADAVRQMAEAATALIDRTILAVASRSAGDHEEFGVIDPLSPKLEVGQKGVGVRVTMRDVNDAPLADLIIGQRVKDADSQRYVRRAGQDLVYVIEIDAAKLSTNFEDWIEKDLLKLNSWDLRQVEVKDYSAELVPVMTRDGRIRIIPQWEPRAEMTFAYDDREAEWSAVTLRRFDPNQGPNGDYVEFALADDEELNEKALNDLKNALDDLKIVDVERKPAGLGRDLRAGDDFMQNEERLKQLAAKGFTAAVTKEGGPLELISSDGEVTATLKDGTEYVLRFGTFPRTDDGPSGDAEANDVASKDGGVHRYLFVMARFNEAAVKQPEVQPLPELPSGAEEPAAETDQATTEAEETTDEAAPESADTEAAADAPADGNEQTAETVQEEAERTDEADEVAETAKEKEIERIIAERNRIEQENQRKLDEYHDTLKKGRENVAELNLRFGDWYFVVDDTVFRKIRLGADDVIQKKQQAAEEDADPADDDDDFAAPGFNFPGLPAIPGVNE